MYVQISPDRMFHVEHLFAFAYMTKGPSLTVLLVAMHRLH
jgi:hypothetical protein